MLNARRFDNIGVWVSDKKLFTTLIALEDTLANLLTQPNFGGKDAATSRCNSEVSANS